MLEGAEERQSLDPAPLLTRFHEVRATTRELLRGLTAEDCQIQSMPDVSPTKWHLAHTTWFFETFLLRDLPHFRPYHPRYEYLYNSYYNTVGEQYARHERGLLSRPSLDEVLLYRRHVQEQVSLAFEKGQLEGKEYVLELGCHHEQQHQELILMDIKHVFASNPLRPAYRTQELPRGEASHLRWLSFDRTVSHLGHEGEGFGFDNEFPRHEALVLPFEIASRLVTNAEYLEFIEDGGYRRPEFWLSDGWTWARGHGIERPFYWVQQDGEWFEMTLCGLQPMRPNTPVCHVSYYEADAYARWREQRLPTEQEWELAAQGLNPTEGNFVEDGRLHPAAAGEAPLAQMYGDVWEWTQSAYSAYPGYTVGGGALGEYNGKFMSNQMVLRGGCCVTPRDHIRA
ncbi:MAG: ergothioneine biosynthesis protein EgtB, partial [Gemmatimonadetes bacterium]|nr:ergothioneine biosynthesis protein EgtB [Gemmatimonadota bacterium]